ncbi:MAG: ABC transporter ATP-binding protein [Clostridia bacterium]|nr:ABC transporter ATP-binding protein [Clostridia bacterium]MBO7245512.1 ABC transporter ATP-binding protein [Clostridia bacterium]MBO7738498.1 ABC transporter ATP-binding protein [Clostridia bacterium]
MIFGKHINRYYFKYAFWLLLGLAALMVVDYAQLMVPALYRLVVNGMNTGMAEIDGVTKVFDMDFLLDNVCLPLVVIIVLMVFGRFLWRICLFGAAIKVETDVRNSMFDHAKNLSRQYYQVHKVGDLMSLFTNDLDTIQECFGSGFLMFFDALFLGALSIIKMWRMNWVMTVLSLIPMLLLLAVSSVIGKYMMRKWELRQQAFSGLSDFSQESFSGIAVIKAFVKEGKELWAFKQLNKENEQANIVFTRASVLLRILVMLFVESVICVILGYGGYLVYVDIFDAGQLVEFIGYFTSTVWPIMAVSELIDLTSRGKASLKRVSELLDAPVDVADKKDAVDMGPVKGEIEFRNLSFRYPDGEFDVLQNVSFKIEAGENVGIVGKTGSGKTTIVDLILRTYNVPDGCLFVDGKDVNSVTIHSLREGCAYVPQDNFLFSDTISANIAFGMDEYDMDTVTESAKLSDVHDNIIDFSEGYSTVLGERGVTVSGGQKQRISIARALMRNAPILILDDSVSAVDTKTEKAILENLRNTRKGQTTLLIAHRISTIEKMDKILFVDNGTVAAVGTHTHLYETNPDYRKMVDLQKLEEEGENNNA